MTQPSDRINYVDERTVEILGQAGQAKGTQIQLCSVPGAHFWDAYSDHVPFYDAAALAALQAVIAAYQRDGDFRQFKPAKKVRPYTHMEAASKLGCWAKRKNSIAEYRLYSVCLAVGDVVFVCLEDTKISSQNFLEHYVWIDGSPCGILED